MEINNKTFLSYFFVFLLLFGLRIYMLANVGLHDYDAVSNYVVASEISTGNFSLLYDHVSPLFNLFYGALAFFSKESLFLQVINLLFNLGAILLLVNFVIKETKLKESWGPVLLLFVGSSFYLVAVSRYFSIESPSLFLFAGLIITLYKAMVHDSKYYLSSAFIFTLLFLINVKVIVLLPVFIVLMYFSKYRITIKQFIQAGFILLAGVVATACIGWGAGDTPVWLYPAKLFYYFNNVPNPAGNNASFNIDLLYYFKFLYHLDNQITLIGFMAFPFIFWDRIKDDVKKMNIYFFLVTLFYLFFFGMCVLAKAPRGIVFVYPVLFVFVFLILEKLIVKSWLILLIVMLSVFYNVYLLQQHVYRYSNSNYPIMADYIKKKNIAKLSSTVGVNLLPYLNGKAILTPAFNLKQVDSLQKLGYQYLLLDAYYIVTNIHQFDSLNQRSDFELEEPSLKAPLLLLEHSEYYGGGFESALLNRDKVLAREKQLELIDLTKK